MSSNACIWFPTSPFFNTSLLVFLSIIDVICPLSSNLNLTNLFSPPSLFKVTILLLLFSDSIILKLLYPLAGIFLAKNIALLSSTFWHTISLPASSNKATLLTPSGISKLAISDLLKPKELNTITLLSFKFILDEIYSKPLFKISFPFSSNSLYYNSVTSYTSLIDEPGIISWNWFNNIVSQESLILLYG